MAELPAAAVERLNRAKRSGVRTSLLSVSSAAGIKAVGLEPVGEVMGCAVRSALLRHPRPYSRWVWDQVRTPGHYFDAFSQPYLEGLRVGYDSALTRMCDEAEALGADGIVGVQLTRTPLGTGDEFVAMGTAVRARSRTRPTTLFTTELSGSDVAKLMLSGWAPVQVQWAGAAHAVFTAGVSEITEARRWWRTINYENRFHTNLVNYARADARQEFHRMIVAADADGGIVSDMTLSVWEPGEGMRAAVAVVYGTAIARFGRADAVPPPTLTVMPLWRQGEC